MVELRWDRLIIPGPTVCHKIGQTGPTTHQAEIMKADQLFQILTNNPSLPVLFISSSIDGDSFAFGTYEELENELEAFREAPRGGEDSFIETAELTTAESLLDRLDFEAYEDQDLTVYR